MATPQTFKVLLRTARPVFRSRSDRIAFAIHCSLVLDGKRLIAVGQSADGSSSGLDARSKDADLTGWNTLDGRYAFLYADEAGTETVTLVKAQELDKHLSVHWLHPGQDVPPRSLQVPIADYTTESSDLVEGYENVDGLLDLLHRGFQSGSPQEAGSGKAAPKAEAPEQESRPRAERRDPLMIGEPRRPQRDPFNGGAEPGFMGDPFGSGGFGGVPGMGGGMHMGPDDPIFRQRFGDDGERPVGGFGHPPGARWDPISGPGTQGFRPGDFARRAGRGPGFTHPDIMPPGPGGPGSFGGGGPSGFGGHF